MNHSNFAKLTCRTRSTATLILMATALWGFCSEMGYAKCPDSELGFAAEDCPWAEIAASWKGEVALRSQAPQIYPQVLRDSKQPALFKLWSMSINFDELAKAEIVPEKILLSLEKVFFSAPGRGAVYPKHIDQYDHRLAHAGLEHTYGYLFSNLKTSFGFKRARWVRGEIEKAFGLSDGLIGPTPKEGTLLSNITRFAGVIAFRDSAANLKLVETVQAAAPLSKIAPASFTIETLEEKITSPRPITIRTDLVKYSQAVADSKNSYLLIYSVRDSNEVNGRLVTAFPVESGFRDTVFKESELGEDKPVKSRYNAYIHGVTGAAPVTGSRKKIQ